MLNVWLIVSRVPLAGQTQALLHFLNPDILQGSGQSCRACRAIRACRACTRNSTEKSEFETGHVGPCEISCAHPFLGHADASNAPCVRLQGSGACYRDEDGWTWQALLLEPYRDDLGLEASATTDWLLAATHGLQACFSVVQTTWRCHEVSSKCVSKTSNRMLQCSALAGIKKSRDIPGHRDKRRPCPIVWTCPACSHVLAGADAHTTTILAQERLYGSSLCHRQLSQKYQELGLTQKFIHFASTLSRTNHFFSLHSSLHSFWMRYL